MGKRKFEAHPQSAPGDFYVIKDQCVTCGVPHVVAPELMAWSDNRDHCFWKRQPQTTEEMEQAVQVLLHQEFDCHRYAGDDPEIMKLIGLDSCDAAD